MDWSEFERLHGEREQGRGRAWADILADVARQPGVPLKVYHRGDKTGINHARRMLRLTAERTGRPEPLVVTSGDAVYAAYPPEVAPPAEDVPEPEHVDEPEESAPAPRIRVVPESEVTAAMASGARRRTATPATPPVPVPSTDPYYCREIGCRGQYIAGVCTEDKAHLRFSPR